MAEDTSHYGFMICGDVLRLDHGEEMEVFLIVLVFLG